MDDQPLPADATCKCGASPTDESVRKHQLSDMGYLHDDVFLECAECGHEWTLGIPIGELEAEHVDDDLQCECGAWRFVHRVTVHGEDITLHLKCPACRSFETTTRDVDSSNVALVGYPQITGPLNDARDYGYENDLLSETS